MTQIIDNDFHPDDRGLNASQEDHWGTVVSKTPQSTSKGDREGKDQSRYGGADLPTRKSGNERDYWGSRDK